MSGFQGKTALVTGASSGIGESLAKQLAALGADLVLVARREDRLQSLASELTQSQGIKVDVIAHDLSQPGAAESLYQAVHDRNLSIDVLVNNAGIGLQGGFLDAELSGHQQTVQVNVAVLSDLTFLFAKDMVAKGSGYILLVASVAAFMPIPNFAIYAASKAYVRSLGESLAIELKSKGVTVSTLCPGGTTTEFFEHSGQQIDGLRTLAMMTSDSVAKAGLDGLIKKKTVVVAGWLNKLSVFLLWLTPRRLKAFFGKLATE